MQEYLWGSFGALLGFCLAGALLAGGVGGGRVFLVRFFVAMCVRMKRKLFSSGSFTKSPGRFWNLPEESKPYVNVPEPYRNLT